MASKPWQGKTALVCGASSGLGRDLVWELAQQGAGEIFLIARNPDRLATVVNEVAEAFPNVILNSRNADACSVDQVLKLHEEFTRTDRVFDIIVQAVGKSDRGTLKELDPERLTQLIDANVRSSLNVLQLLTSNVKQPGGCVVFIGSLASRFTPRFLGGYAIAKHALAALAGQARLELSELGIHVMLACPGPIQRADSGTRYSSQNADSQNANSGLPPDAMLPGGGAKIKGLDSRTLARDILSAAAGRKPEIIRPRRAQILLLLSALSTRLSDWIIRKKTT